MLEENERNKRHVLLQGSMVHGNMYYCMRRRFEHDNVYHMAMKGMRGIIELAY